MGKDGRVGMGKDGGLGMGRDGVIGMVRDEGERDRYGEGRNGGGREWCSLTWPRRRPCPIMRASHRSQAVVSGAAIVVSVCGRLWALVSHSCPFVGPRVVFVSVHGPRVVLVSVRGRPCPFVGPRVALVGVCVVFVSVGGCPYPYVGVPLGVMGGVTWALCLM